MNRDVVLSVEDAVEELKAAAAVQDVALEARKAAEKALYAAEAALKAATDRFANAHTVLFHTALGDWQPKSWWGDADVKCSDEAHVVNPSHA